MTSVYFCVFELIWCENGIKLSVAEKLSQEMDILILNSCTLCMKEEWTPILSNYYVCSECNHPHCPKCKDTEVMFVVSLKNEARTTQVLKCLSEDCLYSEDHSIDADLKKSEKGQNARRCSLKAKTRKFVCRKLNFDV